MPDSYSLTVLKYYVEWCRKLYMQNFLVSMSASILYVVGVEVFYIPLTHNFCSVEKRCTNRYQFFNRTRDDGSFAMKESFNTDLPKTYSVTSCTNAVY